MNPKPNFSGGYQAPGMNRGGPGNPGGVYNMPPDNYHMAYYQQPNLGRYRPPTMEGNTWNDSGGYNYNLPGSYGGWYGRVPPQDDGRWRYGSEQARRRGWFDGRYGPGMRTRNPNYRGGFGWEGNPVAPPKPGQDSDPNEMRFYPQINSGDEDYLRTNYLRTHENSPDWLTADRVGRSSTGRDWNTILGNLWGPNGGLQGTPYNGPSNQEPVRPEFRTQEDFDNWRWNNIRPPYWEGNHP